MYNPEQKVKLLIQSGINKVKLPIIKTIVLSIFGGMFVGASSALATICSFNSDLEYPTFLFGLMFPIGTIIAYIAGGELFPGNCLLFIPFACGFITLLELLLSWLLVLFGNFIGSLIISLLIVYGHIPNMFEVTLSQLIINIGIEKCSLNFGEAFIQSMLANILNCAGIWMAIGGQEIKSIILALFPPLFAIGVCNLFHSVADMYLILAAIFTGYEYGLDSIQANWGKLFYKNIIPVVIGNIVGGCVFFGLPHYYIYLNQENKIQPPMQTITDNTNANDLDISKRALNTPSVINNANPNQ